MARILSCGLSSPIIILKEKFHRWVIVLGIKLPSGLWLESQSNPAYFHAELDKGPIWIQVLIGESTKL
jgi:hypothetical protein